MRSRRITALVVAVLVAMGVTAVGGPAAAAPSRATAATASAKPGSIAAKPATAAGRPWTFAGKSCLLLPTSVHPTAGAERVAAGCAGVRPGAPVLTPIGQCTFNFLFRGSDGHDYIGTAGHCLLEGSRQTQAVFPGAGPPAGDSSGQKIGEFAYAALDEVSDFALIRLAPGVAANPAVCTFGGPTGLNSGAIPGLTALQHVGLGTVTGSFAPARTQLAVDSGDPRFLTGLGVASPGDSGSPVVGPDGRAVGIVVATGPVLPLLPAGLFVFNMRIAPEIARAAAATGIAYDLVTAPMGTGLLRP